MGKRDKFPSEIGRQAVEELLKDLSHKACVDRYLEDQVSDFSERHIPFNAIYTQQLILLMALAKGHSKIRCGSLSDRTKTAIFVVEQLTDVSFCLTKFILFNFVLSQVKFSITESFASYSTTMIGCDGIGYQRRF